MKQHSLALLFSALVLPSAADTLSVVDEDSTQAPLVITSGRQPEMRQTATAATSVFTRADIERVQARSVEDLLARVPGVVTRTSGGVISYSIRGTKTAQTLVLVDGQRIASASSGIARLDYLNIENIERVEVSRGPRSSLYGADAIGGVIQILTRRAHRGIHPSVRLAGGTEQTWQRSANLNLGSNQTRFSLGASLDETDGHYVTRDHLGADSDHDGVRNQAYYLNVVHDFSKKWQAGLQYNQQSGKNEYDDAFEQTPGTPSDKFRVEALNSYVQGQLQEYWLSRVELGRSYDRNKAVGSGSAFGNGSNTTTRHSSSWLNHLQLSPQQQLSLGADWYEDMLDSTTAYPEESRSNTGFFAQHRLTDKHLFGELGVRSDHNQAYGNQTSWNGSMGWQTEQQQRWQLSYSEGFRAPTFNDLYYPGSGNPYLQAETSKNWELQWRHTLDAVYLEASLYRNDINNLISFSGSQPENIGQARINGFESSLQSNLLGWQTALSVSLLDPRNQDDGRVLPLTPKRSLSLDLDRSFEAYSLGATWRLVSDSRDYSTVDQNFAAQTAQIPGYGLLNLRTSWRVHPNVRFNLQVENALDHDYYTALYQRFDSNFVLPPGIAYGYQESGRTALLALHWAL